VLLGSGCFVIDEGEGLMDAKIVPRVRKTSKSHSGSLSDGRTGTKVVRNG
jgi:hypothetical protein